MRPGPGKPGRLPLDATTKEDVMYSVKNRKYIYREGIRIAEIYGAREYWKGQLICRNFGIKSLPGGTFFDLPSYCYNDDICKAVKSGALNDILDKCYSEISN